MKKLFISQPMNGLDDSEILQKREAAFKDAQDRVGEELQLIDSFIEEAPHDANPLWFLGKSLELLSTADYAYFATGWQDARGCKVEHLCAKEYGITYLEQ